MSGGCRICESIIKKLDAVEQRAHFADIAVSFHELKHTSGQGLHSPTKLGILTPASPANIPDKPVRGNVGKPPGRITSVDEDIDEIFGSFDDEDDWVEVIIPGKNHHEPSSSSDDDDDQEKWIETVLEKYKDQTKSSRTSTTVQSTGRHVASSQKRKHTPSSGRRSSLSSSSEETDSDQYVVDDDFSHDVTSDSDNDWRPPQPKKKVKSPEKPAIAKTSNGISTSTQKKKIGPKTALARLEQRKAGAGKPPKLDQTKKELKCSKPVQERKAPTGKNDLKTSKVEEKKTPKLDKTQTTRIDKATPRIDKTAPRICKSTPRIDKATPRIDEATPRIDKATPRIDKTAPRIDKTTPRIDKATPRIDKATPRIVKATPRIDKTTPRIDKATPRIDKTTPRIDKAKPNISGPNRALARLVDRNDTKMPVVTGKRKRSEAEKSPIKPAKKQKSDEETYRPSSHTSSSVKASPVKSIITTRRAATEIRKKSLPLKKRFNFEEENSRKNSTSPDLGKAVVRKHNKKAMVPDDESDDEDVIEILPSSEDGHTEARSLFKEGPPVTVGVKVKKPNCTVVMKKINYKSPWVVAAEDEKNDCILCGLPCSTRSSFIYHIKTKHSNETPFGCQYCGARYKERGYKSFCAHVKRHRGRKPFTCRYCSNTFSDIETYRLHTMTHIPDELYSCIYCHDRYTSAAAYLRHVTTHTGTKPFRCILCPEYFTSEATRETHERSNCLGSITTSQHVSDSSDEDADVDNQNDINDTDDDDAQDDDSEDVDGSDENDEKGEEEEKEEEEEEKKTDVDKKKVVYLQDTPLTYSCGLCERNFCSYSGMASHYRQVHDGQQKCSQCQQRFRTKTQLHEHEKIHLPRPFPCDLCEEKFQTNNKLSVHYTQVHCNSKPEACDQCERSFNTKEQLQNHKLSHFLQSANKGKDSNGKLWCETCERTFATTLGLHSHFVQVHSTTVKCDQCQETFNSRIQLRSHMLTHFPKPFQCDECDRSFSSDLALTKHGMHVHNRKPQECDQCDKKFKTKQQLKEHKRAHDVIIKEKKTFKCSICVPNKTYSSSYKLLCHARSHHSGDLKYECKDCGRKFMQWNGLKWHMSTAHGTPYLNKCDVCDKNFLLASELREHKREHDDWLFVCRTCEEGFMTKDTMSVHMAAEHFERGDDDEDDDEPPQETETVQATAEKPLVIDPNNVVDFAGILKLAAGPSTDPDQVMAQTLVHQQQQQQLELHQQEEEKEEEEDTRMNFQQPISSTSNTIHLPVRSDSRIEFVQNIDGVISVVPVVSAGDATCSENISQVTFTVPDNLSTMSLPDIIPTAIIQSGFTLTASAHSTPDPSPARNLSVISDTLTTPPCILQDSPLKPIHISETSSPIMTFDDSNSDLFSPQISKITTLKGYDVVTSVGYSIADTSIISMPSISSMADMATIEVSGISDVGEMTEMREMSEIKEVGEMEEMGVMGEVSIPISTVSGEVVAVSIPGTDAVPPSQGVVNGEETGLGVVSDEGISVTSTSSAYNILVGGIEETFRENDIDID